LEFFAKKYEIFDKSNNYIPEDTSKGYKMKYCGQSADKNNE